MHHKMSNACTQYLLRTKHKPRARASPAVSQQRGWFIAMQYKMSNACTRYLFRINHMSRAKTPAQQHHNICPESSQQYEYGHGQTSAQKQHNNTNTDTDKHLYRIITTIRTRTRTNICPESPQQATSAQQHHNNTDAGWETLRKTGLDNLSLWVVAWYK
jgi:hypothetical protein